MFTRGRSVNDSAWRDAKFERIHFCDIFRCGHSFVVSTVALEITFKKVLVIKTFEGVVSGFLI